jgi:hypothetical protein
MVAIDIIAGINPVKNAVSTALLAYLGLATSHGFIAGQGGQVKP